MTTLTLSHPTYDSHDIGHGFVGQVSAIARGIVEGIAAHRRYKALSALSDHQLAQLGIGRKDVAAYVMNGKPTR